ncbi:hypothetical protein Rs2_10026 [Raphanus sativus]|nr:hypothetical protein Rs2_10026 [Raphanus sativus]
MSVVPSPKVIWIYAVFTNQPEVPESYSRGFLGPKERGEKETNRDGIMDDQTRMRGVAENEMLNKTGSEMFISSQRQGDDGYVADREEGVKLDKTDDGTFVMGTTGSNVN